LSVLQGGCRTPPEQRLPAGASQLAWEQRIARLSGWVHWSFNGRVAIRHGEEGWQAGLNWRQDSDYFEIQVLDPLGRKVADIRGDSRGVHLTTSRGEKAQAADSESLMRQVLGWSLPLSGMRYWVLGELAAARRSGPTGPSCPGWLGRSLSPV
jgi:outer membrane lipoprotein LolB